MKQLLNALVVTGLVSLSSCAATQQSTQTPFLAATPIITTPQYVNAPVANNVKLVTGQDAALEKAFKQYMKTGKAPNILSDGFITLAYNQSSQPIIKTMPFQETVISLEVGEQFSDITSGDPDRWDYGVAVSGSGVNKQQHILVKPSADNLATNMVIATDRRMYNLRLISSSQGTPTRDVRFWYPQQMMSEINAVTQKQVEMETISTASTVNVDQMNFNYQMTTEGGGFFASHPSWKPVQVFDDGRETFIQFPESISSDNLPALLVEDNGKTAIVNYRKKQPYFVVDRIFKKAVLVMDVGSDKRQVTLINQNYH